jgi:hypothetical protein
MKLKNNFNDLITLRHVASSSSKRMGDSFAIVNTEYANFFLLKLKTTLDTALTILPFLASQFDDLLRKFHDWQTKSEINLNTLSRICDHLKEIVTVVDHLTKLNTVNFNSFNTSQPQNFQEFYKNVK